MDEITVIIHGWSDCSASFKKLKQFLVKNGVGDVHTIYYADYESREDNLTFYDVIDGLYDRFKEKGFIDRDGKGKVKLNVIVHSTGGLVIRHFISEYYSGRIDDCPVKKIVMLAPANFGSPLAQYGKSLLGMVFKGRYKFGDLFEVGRKLLDGLELASPYQWFLAHRDILVQQPFYNRNQIQTFIFVGSEGYSGLRKIVNKKGTDGTVVISGTDINSVKFSVDFTTGEENISVLYPGVDVVFGVIKGYNHGSIVDDIKPEGESRIGRLILRALKVSSPGEFGDFKSEMKETTEKTFRGKEVYQQFFIRAVDDHGKPVRDYTVEFFVYKYNSKYLKNREITKKRLSAKELYWSEKIHSYLADEFHRNSTDPSFRRFLVGIKGLKKRLKECYKDLGSDVVLSVRIHVPKVDQGIYYDTNALKNIFLLKTENGLLPEEDVSLFYPNTTTLMELKVNRSTKYVTVGLQPRKH